jgi:hypothetical protein
MKKSVVELIGALGISGLFVARVGAATIYVAEEQLTRVSIATPSGPHPFSGGVGLVYGLALDGQGNLYAAGAGDDVIRKITPGGAVSVYASGSELGSPAGMAFDSAGNLYTSGLGWGKTVDRISPDGTITHVASGVGGYGLAFDSTGDLYVANWDSVAKITPSGTVSTFATGLQGAWGLAFDSTGNLFVANYNGDYINKITPDGTMSVFAAGLDRPTGLAFDGSGNLFVCDDSESQLLGYISQITPNGTVSTFSSGFNFPTAIAILVPEPSLLSLSVLGLVAMPLVRHFRRAKEIDRSA